MFNKVDPKAALPAMEEKMLRYWEENNIFEKSLAQREGKEKFIFFDGPPFANGLPHYGHILANVLKDAVTRYWTMRGYYVPRRNGWDCHGLPVEYEIEKELELNGRKEIVDYGIENFNNMCRESVFRYTKEWEQLLKRLGRWVDFGDSYATLENNYMESIWWVFKQIWDAGQIYEGFKSMHVCPRCETPLSNFEVSQGYKDVTDLSAIVKFKLNDDALDAIGSTGENVFVLAWTTTPWTLPGNVALAFGTEIEYRKIAYHEEDGSQSYYVVAKDLSDAVFGENNYLVVGEVSPQALVGKSYQPVFDYYIGQEIEGNLYKIYTADFVTTDDGTGIVHIAPMFGQDDYDLGVKNGTALIQHVNMDGTFTDDIKGFEGKFVKGQDANIAKVLQERGLLFKKQNYQHSYPHCWRCDTPLLNFAARSFFVKVTDVKDKMLKNNSEINWQPDHIQDGRFGKWLEGARDWAISRNRFWGCPIPVWESETGEKICIGSIEELKQLAGGDLPLRGDELDLHRPYIDDIILKSPTDGSEMRRVPDVLDCWFESGAMPYAQLHYPFENKKEFESNFPANFIAEGLDQTRGWFYTLHVLSTLLFDRPAFKNVIVNGILLAKDGEKLSKRKKNYPDPSLLFDTKGVDSTRFFLCSSTAPLAEDVRFSEDHVDEIVKKFTLTLWNTYSFFVTYANIDDFEPLESVSDFVPKNKLDRWMLSELHSLIKEVTENMDQYNLPKSVRPMMDLVENLSNWYVRRSRRRFWKSENDADKSEAYQTLHIVLVELSKLLAPFMPFIADEIYQNLTGEDSVHLADWPKANESLIDSGLNTEIRFLRLIVNLGHSVRSKVKIKVRQPLSMVKVALPEGVSPELILSQEAVILEELNVKKLEIISESGDLVDRMVVPNSRVLGPKYGADVQKIIQLIKSGDYDVLESGGVRVGDYLLEEDEVDIGFKGKDGGYDLESEGGVVVALDTIVTPELKNEGYARDIVRHIQEMRKECNYEVDDRILVLIEARGDLELAITHYADYIKIETLADELIQSDSIESDLEKSLKVDDFEVVISIKKI